MRSVAVTVARPVKAGIKVFEAIWRRVSDVTKYAY